jgi:hypothetical protein
LCSLISHHFVEMSGSYCSCSYTCHSYKCVDWNWIQISCAWLRTVKYQSQKTSSCNLPKYVWFPLLSPILLYQYYINIISYISCVHPTCLHLGCVSSHLSVSVYWHFIWRSLVFFFHHQCTQNDPNLIITLVASWNTRLNDCHLVWLVNNNNSYCSLREVELGTIWDIQTAYTK